MPENLKGNNDEDKHLLAEMNLDSRGILSVVYDIGVLSPDSAWWENIIPDLRSVSPLCAFPSAPHSPGCGQCSAGC